MTKTLPFYVSIMAQSWSLFGGSNCILGPTVVVDSMFVVVSIVCWDSVFCVCF